MIWAGYLLLFGMAVRSLLATNDIEPFARAELHRQSEWAFTFAAAIVWLHVALGKLVW